MPSHLRGCADGDSRALSNRVHTLSLSNRMRIHALSNSSNRMHLPKTWGAPLGTHVNLGELALMTSDLRSLPCPAATGTNSPGPVGAKVRDTLCGGHEAEGWISARPDMLLSCRRAVWCGRNVGRGGSRADILFH